MKSALINGVRIFAPASFEEIIEYVEKVPSILVAVNAEKIFNATKITRKIINNNLGNPTKMYLLKNDPVEIIEEKDNWLKIKYYPEKNGEWTGKTIEGWIKKSDVE
jgi:hypothetical protein